MVFSFVIDGLDNLFSFFILLMNHKGNLVRLFIVKSCQEFNGRIGIIEAAKGIETRSNLKTNRFFIDIPPDESLRSPRAPANPCAGYVGEHPDRI